MARDILEELVTKFTYDVDQAGLNKYLRSQEKINRNTKNMIGLNTTLNKGLMRFIGFLGAGVGINSLINTYRNLDLMRRSIEGLTQSTQDWEFLTKEAFRTATAIDVVAQSYKGFYAAANMSKFSKDEIQGMYGDLLTGLRGAGSTPERVKGALLAIEQMFSKGTIQAQELRLQLGNALPGAFELMASAVGVTTKELDTMMRKGLLPATKYVPLLIKEIKGYYESGFIKNVKSLDAAMINLGNAWKLFQDEIMRGSAGQELAKSLNMLTDFLRSPAAISVAQGIGKALQMVVKGLGLIVKHWRMILFLWGVNSLMSGIASLNALRWRILDIATTMNNGLAPSLNNVVASLAQLIFYGGGVKNTIIAIGKALVPLGRSMLWLTLIAGVLYGIYLIIEDIFTYINHPEWDSVTKELVEQLPFIGDMIESIKDTFREMQPFIHDIQQVWGEIGQDIIDFLKDSAPLMTAYLKYSITKTIILAKVLTTILDLLMKISKFFGYGSDFAKDHPFQFGLTGGGLNPINVIRSHTYKRKPDIRTPMDMNYLTDLGQANYLGALSGGYNFNKVETDNKSVTNTFQIYAQNRTDAELMALISQAIGGEIDNIENMVNPTGKYVTAGGR